ncbi:TPA: glycosyltransferase family 2 protein [bacterium]|nr:glycosyltransferase family 2 protein [bacterium]
MDKAISIVIPVFNEEGGIGEVVEKTKSVFESLGWEFEIIVVDDGSSDNTGKKAEEKGARVIRHPVNIGYGKTILSGIANSKYGLIGIIDGDGSYNPEDFPKLLEFSQGFDMVVGARKGVHYRGSLLKLPARYIFQWMAEYVTGERIPDVNSGMRIFKKEVVKKISHIICPGFSFSTTLTLNLLWQRCFVKFVPIQYHKRVGKSHVRYIRDTLRAGQILVTTLVYFNPIKAILPLAGVSFILSIIFLFSWIFLKHEIWLITALMSFFSFLNLFAIGLIMEIIRMRTEK